MTKTIIHIGGIFADTRRRVLDAVAAAENGPVEPQDHLTFESQELLNTAQMAANSANPPLLGKIDGNVS